MRLKHDELIPESERPIESSLRGTWTPPNPAIAFSSDPALLSRRGIVFWVVLTGALLIAFALIWGLSQ